jgi:hypothetical protein
MNWLTAVLTSEFVWGIILGMLLAIVVAGANAWIDTERRRKNTQILFFDLVNSVCDLIDALEDHRGRTRLIEKEFLELIDAEIAVYGRTRVYVTVLQDVQLRRDVRDFFTRVAVTVAKVNSNLRRFIENEAIARSGSAQYTTARAAGNDALSEAHRACDRLRELATRRNDLIGRLQA